MQYSNIAGCEVVLNTQLSGTWESSKMKMIYMPTTGVRDYDIVQRTFEYDTVQLCGGNGQLLEHN